MVCQARHTKYSEPAAPPFAMPPAQFDVRDLEPSRPNMPSSSDTGIRQKAGVSGILYLFLQPISGYSIAILPGHVGGRRKKVLTIVRKPSDPRRALSHLRRQWL